MLISVSVKIRFLYPTTAKATMNWGYYLIQTFNHYTFFFASISVLFFVTLHSKVFYWCFYNYTDWVMLIDYYPLKKDIVLCNSPFHDPCDSLYQSNKNTIIKQIQIQILSNTHCSAQQPNSQSRWCTLSIRTWYCMVLEILKILKNIDK